MSKRKLEAKQVLFVNEMGAGIDWLDDEENLLRRDYKLVWKSAKTRLVDHALTALISVVLAIIS